MKRIVTVAAIALLSLLAAEALARAVEMSKAPRARGWETYRGRFLIEFLGGSVCLGLGTHTGKTIPQRLEEQLRHAGLARASVLNLCQAEASSTRQMAIFLQYGLPLAPQVVLSFDGVDEIPPSSGLAIRRLAELFIGNVPRPNPKSALNSYLYATEVTRTLTQAQGGWYAVLLQPSTVPAMDALTNWSIETGAPVFDLTRAGKHGHDAIAEELDRRGLFATIAGRYRDWEAHADADADIARSAPWPR